MKSLLFVPVELAIRWVSHPKRRTESVLGDALSIFDKHKSYKTTKATKATQGTQETESLGHPKPPDWPQVLGFSTRQTRRIPVASSISSMASQAVEPMAAV